MGEHKRHNPLPENTEMIEPGTPASIGLGNPVVAHVTASPSEPMTAESLDGTERPRMDRATFLAKYPLNRSCANAFIPQAFLASAEKKALANAPEPSVGKLV